MFEATVRANVLKEFAGVISTLTDEAKFIVNPKGVTVNAVDPAHVAMVDLTLNAKAFEKYSASDMEMGVDIEKLGEVLRLAKGDDQIFLKFDEEKNKLIVQVENITRRMSLVDTAGMSEPKIPNLNLPVKVVAKTAELERGIRASEAVSDHVALIASPEGFELVSEGEMDSVSLKLPKKLLVELNCKERAKSLFSLDYFSKMIKAVITSENVVMNLGTDYPVKMEFDIAKGNGHATYLLAPRIESE
ncbi:MAG: proliferating cell nuclear antigen (pcna) [Euryarchaeota archaeon CG_4_9_14_3_um_filter_38_12]|nr:MAG: proliferating cell nuclear antigen (pcna) [Euryarchaeota archaeon CG_4_9_14_3_um_filter_38_12]